MPLHMALIHDVLAVDAGHVDGDDAAAGRDDDLVGIQGAQGVHVDLGVQLDLDVGMKLHLLVPVGHQRLDVGIEHLGHGQQAGELVGLLKHGHLVPALGRHAGRLQAARAGAHDGDVLFLGSRLVLGQAHFHALPHVRVHRALAGLADEDVVQAAGAHDAGTHLLRTALLHLAGGVGIGDELARHAHRVAVALGDDLLAHVERVDAGAGEDGLAGHGLHLLREVDELALGHDLVGHGAGRLVEAGLHGPGVNAMGLDDRDELEGVGDAVAVGHEVIGGDAHENRHVIAAGLVNLVDDLAEETGAVLGRSAVLVGAVVGVLGKEAHHHVADARVDLDDVDAGILAAAGGLAVLLDDLGDLLFGVLALGHAHERAGGHVLGRSVGQKRIVARGTPLIAQLQLGGNLGSVVVAHLGDALEAGDELIVPASAGAGGRVVLRLGAEAVAHVARPDLDQAGMALCALLVEIHQVIGHVVVVHLLDGHRQHHETVAQLDIADLKRLHQFLVLRHG